MPNANINGATSTLNGSQPLLQSPPQLQAAIFPPNVRPVPTQPFMQAPPPNFQNTNGNSNSTRPLMNNYFLNAQSVMPPMMHPRMPMVDPMNSHSNTGTMSPQPISQPPRPQPQPQLPPPPASSFGTPMTNPSQMPPSFSKTNIYNPVQVRERSHGLVWIVTKFAYVLEPY